MDTIPVPVLALLAFVGLATYATIGGAVGAVTVRIMKPYSPFGGFLWSAILWPAWLSLVMVGGAVFVVIGAPGFLMVKVGSYLGDEKLKDELL